MLQPVGVNHRTQILTPSLTQPIMNLEMIAQLYRTRIVILLTVSNALGPGPKATQLDGMVMMLGADVSISKVMSFQTREILL